MDKLSKVKVGENYPRAERNTWNMFKYHKVKHWNRNNSAADCSIAFKFGTEFHHVTDDTLQVFKVKGQGHGVKYVSAAKHYNMAMDRFSAVKLGMAS